MYVVYIVFFVSIKYNIFFVNCPKNAYGVQGRGTCVASDPFSLSVGVTIYIVYCIEMAKDPNRKKTFRITNL